MRFVVQSLRPKAYLKVFVLYLATKNVDPLIIRFLILMN